MSVAIKVENLSKKYIIQHEKKSAHYETLSDTLIQGSKNVITRMSHPFTKSRIEQQTQEEFWALKDINFEINQGDRLGIIGRNGAGKSTLLKILSRITEPTSGKIHINGRIASLLEVGTGFHPELTGRENIFLNGAILGMSRAEVKTKFDEIVAFAEVEKFLDTPVKRYSSGMYVRLAFAVAAHLEPEILIIDEVLAVGDAQFQKKCLGKMEEAGKDGRTVIFVSHSMATVQSLCDRVLWINAGRMVKDGETGAIINDYLRGDLNELSRGRVLKSFSDLVIEQVILKDKTGNMANSFFYNQSLAIEIYYFARKKIESPYFWLAIKGVHGNMFAANMLLDGRRPAELLDHGVLVCCFPNLRLTPGYYSISMGVRDSSGNDLLVESGVVANFEMLAKAEDMGFFSDLVDVHLPQTSQILVPYEWQLPDGSTYKVASL